MKAFREAAWMVVVTVVAMLVLMVMFGVWWIPMEETARAAWATALGTGMLAVATVILAAVTAAVTVFGGWLRARFIRPQLEVQADTDHAYCPKMPLIYAERVAEGMLTRAYDNYQIRIGVRNKGNAIAKDVEVFATALRIIEQGKPPAAYPRLLPSNLQWTYNMSVLPRLMPTPPESPGRFCDVAHVLNPDQRWLPGEYIEEHPKDKTWLSMLYASRPSDLSHILLPGTYELDIQVSASNAAPIEATLELSLSGTWYPDEEDMLKHVLSIRVLRQAPA
jgi:hypothetical protein